MRVRLTLTAAVATVLASIGLYPLFIGGGWFTTSVAAILVVTGTALLYRRFRLPPWLGLASGVAALLLFLTMLFAGPQAYGGLIPTPASMARLWDLTVQGWRASNTYAAPVPLFPGIRLLAVAGIGAVALAVDFLAVSLRRAAPAGLPLLATYSLPAAVRDESVSWLAFLLCATGFLALLMADAREQVNGWGRPIFTRHWSSRDRRETPDSTAMVITGRRIGLTAMVLAVGIPLALPGLQTQGLFGMGGLGSRSQTARITMPDPLVSLKRQLTLPENAAVLTYRGPPDSGGPDYLRVSSLDRFDGEQWTMTPVRGTRNDRVAGRALPAPPGLSTAPKRQVTAQISVDRRVDRLAFLPAPYPPTRVEIGGDWRVDRDSLMIYALREVGGGVDYKVTSLRVEPTSAQLRAVTRPRREIAQRYLDIPRNVPDDIIRLARQVTEDVATPYAKAMKLQDWFTQDDRFTYNTQVPSPRNVSALRDFLLRSRTGYCEQFAASMALMARIADIPARVAVGYTQGVPGPRPGEWVVSSHDAHAWPELYFEGAGWLRFEPTPAGVAGQGTATLPTYTVPTPAGGGAGGDEEPTEETSPQPGPSASAGAPLGERRREPVDAARGTQPGDGGRAEEGVPIGVYLAAAGALLLAATPAVARVFVRRRRWRRAGDPHGAADAAWTELRDDMIDYGAGWNPSESPRQAARGIAGRLEFDETATAALNRIARAEERSRYAPEPDPGSTLRADGRTVRRALAARAGRGQRVRARALPMSVLAVFRGAGWRVLEAFDWLDLLGARRSPGRYGDTRWGRAAGLARLTGLLRGGGASAPRSGP
jgi:transglutaminase-like putative cysteine protease